MTDWMLFAERANVQRSGLAEKTPGTSVSPTPADGASTSVPEFSQSIKQSAATKDQSMHTTTNQANYRPLQSRNESSTPIFIPKKRKHSSKPGDPRPIRYFEDSSDEDEDDGHQSGDGSSSGDSIASDGPAKAKRPRTSRVATRSLTRTTIPDLTAEELSNPPSPAPAPQYSLPALTSTAVTTARGARFASPSTNPTTPTPFTSTTETQTEGTPLDTTGNASSRADTPGDSVHTETEVATTETTAITGTEVAGTGAEVVVTGTDAVAQPRLTTGSPQITVQTTPPSVTTIDESDIPSFLLRHGKKARQVNIFAYLNKVQDPHFRQLLFHYIQFEVNDMSGMGGTLPTAKRPVEISQWTSRARPATLPDFTKKGRTFQMFVESVFEWWGSIQPTWRVFKRNRVSREVNGGWDALHSPLINGLLNVVILAYWWVQTLDELTPEGSVRADYEFFAEDVAWVFSKLST